MPARAELTTIVLDCTDPGSLAEFYRAVTDWEITYSDETYAHLGKSGPIGLGFQRVDGYRPPGWPDATKQARLDFAVQDRDGVVKDLVALGASVPEFQPGGDEWVVLADPAGHLFCLISAD